MPEKGDSNCNNRHKHLGWRGIESANVDEKLQPEIVDQEIDGYNDTIAEELLSTTERGLGKGDILIEPKACEEGDGEDNAQRGYVGRKGDKAEVEHLVTQEEVVDQEIEYPVEHHVACAADAIAEKFDARCLMLDTRQSQSTY